MVSYIDGWTVVSPRRPPIIIMKTCKYFLDGDVYNYRTRQHNKATTRCGKKAVKSILGIDYCLEHYNKVVVKFLSEYHKNKG